FGNIIAFDEAVKFNRQIGIAQDLRCAADMFVTLNIFGADIENSNRRPFETENGAGEGLPHHGKIDELIGIGADIRTNVEHNSLSTLGGPQRGDRRTVDVLDNAKL